MTVQCTPPMMNIIMTAPGVLSQICCARPCRRRLVMACFEMHQYVFVFFRSEMVEPTPAVHNLPEMPTRPLIGPIHKS